MVCTDGELGPVEVWVEVGQAPYYCQQLLPRYAVVPLWPAELGAIEGYNVLLRCPCWPQFQQQALVGERVRRSSSERVFLPVLHSLLR